MTIRQLRIKKSNKYPFKLDAVLNDTQDFRWCKLGGGWHSGVLTGQHIHVRQSGNVLEYYSGPDSDLNALLHSYFRLDDPIDDIYADLSSRDQKVAGLIANYPWLRIMRQPDPWECMAAFLCSALATPLKIAERVERMAKKLGDPLELNGEVRYTFPAPEKFLCAGVEELKGLQLGLRGVPRYIIAAAERICDGKLDLCGLAQPEVSYGEARLRLMDCDGIGGKIADCIALFSLDKMKAFPVDSRVRKAVKAHYFPCLEKQSNESIVIWAQERFGPYAGYANQFLYTSS